MYKAKRPDITTFNHVGHIYRIYDAYPTHQGANAFVRSLKTKAGSIYQGYETKAVAVDLGPEAGRLRYAVFECKGGKTNYTHVPAMKKSRSRK